MGLGTVLSWRRRHRKGHRFRPGRSFVTDCAGGSSLRRGLYRRALLRRSPAVWLPEADSQGHEGWPLDGLFFWRKRINQTVASRGCASSFAIHRGLFIAVIGGLFLRIKALDCLLSVYTNSETSVAAVTIARIESTTISG